MRFSTTFAVVAGAIPTMVRAMPAPDVQGNGEYIGTLVYKRHDVLSSRDLSLAEKHGVDVTKMIRHSLIRRADGDDITIWVHNSYQENDTGEEEDSSTSEAALAARAHVWGGSFDSGLHHNQCGHSSFEGLTSDRSAYTGGVQEMYRWANTRRGGFSLQSFCCGGNGNYDNIVIAGSNSGANARFGIRQTDEDRILPGRVGTEDIRDLAGDSLDRYQQNRNGWRVAARGQMSCATGMRAPFVQAVNIQWIIGRVDQRVRLKDLVSR
ncbi:hypothetical protein HYQ44_007593 [Verticillium longisporum]|nr:hypothetical protein HYQ44_007593 [Verticillium longisporum]